MSDARLRTEDSFPPLWRRWKPIALLAVLITIAVPFVYRWWQQRTVEELLAAARARGEPITPAELDAFYQRPASSEDCTALYLFHESNWHGRFHKALDTLPFFDSDIKPPRLDEAWEGLAAAEEFLAGAQPELEGWHVAAARGGRSRFPMKFEDGFMTLLPYTQAMRGIARTLALEAHRRAYFDDPAGAAESLRAAIITGRALENEPIVVSQLVRMACHGIALDEIKRLLPQLDFSAADLARLQAELEATDFRAGLRRGIIGDRVMGIVSAKYPTKMGYTKPIHTWVHYAGRQQLERSFLEQCERMIKLSELPWPEMVVQVENEPDVGKPGPFDWNPVQEFVGGMSTYMRAGARATAVNDVGIMSLAIARYRLDHGQPPDKLEDLVPVYLRSVPIDALTGKPFHYTAGPDGVTLSSEWRNRFSQIDPETGADRNLLFRWPAEQQPLETEQNHEAVR